MLATWYRAKRAVTTGTFVNCERLIINHYVKLASIHSSEGVDSMRLGVRRGDPKPRGLSERNERLDSDGETGEALGMETKWEGFIAGVFEGYQCGRTFELSDGARWRQESREAEYVYREQPRARLLWNQSLGRWYLDVEGTSSAVWVEPERGGLAQMGLRGLLRETASLEPS